MPSEVIVAGAFKIINFIIVILGAGFVFRKYFAPTVSQNMHAQELHIVQKQERTATLRREQRIIDERITQDKQYAQTLTKKIEHWCDCVEDKRKQEAQKDGLLQAAIEQKQAIQKKRIQQKWVAQQVLPHALQQVEDQLKQEYAPQERQEQFVDTIIKNMKHRL